MGINKPLWRDRVSTWAWKAGVRTFRLGRRVGIAGALEPLLWPVANKLLPVSDQETHALLPSGLPLVLPPKYRDARTVAAGLFQIGLTRLLGRRLRPGMTVVDAGAYIGYFTVTAAHAVGDTGRVYAFEPNSAARDYLRRNVELNRLQNVVMVPKAVSNSSGTSRLVRDPLGPESFVTQGGAFDDAELIDTVSLDAFFSSCDWPAIDLVRMNIEGSEHAALQGMTGLCQRNPDLEVIMEFNPRALARAGVTRSALTSTLSDLGFVSSYVIEDAGHPTPEGFLPAGQAVFNLLLTRRPGEKGPRWRLTS